MLVFDVKLRLYPLFNDILIIASVRLSVRPSVHPCHLKTYEIRVFLIGNFFLFFFLFFESRHSQFGRRRGDQSMRYDGVLRVCRKAQHISEQKHWAARMAGTWFLLKLRFFCQKNCTTTTTSNNNNDRQQWH